MDATQAVATPGVAIAVNGHHEPTREELLARIKELEARPSAQPRSIGFKVGEKGALSMYGVGRFPVTLYASQWRTVLANVKGIEESLVKFASVLSEKPVK